MLWPKASPLDLDFGLCAWANLFNFRSVRSLVNILVQNKHRKKIKDSLTLRLESAVEKRMKKILRLPRRPRNDQKESVNSFFRNPVAYCVWIRMVD